MIPYQTTPHIFDKALLYYTNTHYSVLVQHCPDVSEYPYHFPET